MTRLDVLEPSSIEVDSAAGVERFGRIDALLNNAGYGAYGPLEAFDRDGIIRQFNTNVIGLLDVTRAILPHFRGSSAAGCSVNISSIGGRITFPLGALYHGTSFAVEGISEALSHELKAIGVKMKMIEPGFVATDFGGRSFDLRMGEELTAYQPVVAAMMQGFQRSSPNASQPGLIAEVNPSRRDRRQRPTALPRWSRCGTPVGHESHDGRPGFHGDDGGLKPGRAMREVIGLNTLVFGFPLRSRRRQLQTLKSQGPPLRRTASSGYQLGITSQRFREQGSRRAWRLVGYRGTLLP